MDDDYDMFDENNDTRLIKKNYRGAMSKRASHRPGCLNLPLVETNHVFTTRLQSPVVGTCHRQDVFDVCDETPSGKMPGSVIHLIMGTLYWIFNAGRDHIHPWCQDVQWLPCWVDLVIFNTVQPIMYQGIMKILRKYITCGRFQEKLYRFLFRFTDEVRTISANKRRYYICNVFVHWIDCFQITWCLG